MSFTIHVDTEMHSELKAIAAQDDCSMNALINEILEYHMDRVAPMSLNAKLDKIIKMLEDKDANPDKNRRREAQNR